MPTNGFSTKPLKVKLLAGEQKATEKRWQLLLSFVRESLGSFQLVPRSDRKFLGGARAIGRIRWVCFGPTSSFQDQFFWGGMNRFGDSRLKETILWMDEILRHLRNPAMMIPPVNTNKPWFSMVSRWCRTQIGWMLRGTHLPASLAQSKPG